MERHIPNSNDDGGIERAAWRRRGEIQAEGLRDGEIEIGIPVRGIVRVTVEGEYHLSGLELKNGSGDGEGVAGDDGKAMVGDGWERGLNVVFSDGESEIVVIGE